ncbi:UTP--glucose-1-phosphate uridylyltransferase [Polyangium sorediatum]|uniref:UTP--glucose-1-phosphate uridylyltransferase n=1 Tax=Polyangium sorediatum TaxID=889274 RepID=A0ABT6NY87_9BACT|nr:UTP--glucose-1-phosphate uridylyltransferase [Polyangium sorediatum]MDI1433305.1 UTP--glucose-1-phosphate uridylyltransferase [Polyangium sorediatum]
MTLVDEIAALPPALLARLRARGFDPDRLAAWAATIGQDRDKRNRYAGEVLPPAAGDVVDTPAPGSPEHARFEALGREALARGEVALCVLAGGMATRMGGVVKALVEALPGTTFLDLRLAEMEALARRAGATCPLWLMTSEATEGPIRAALGGRLDKGDVATFEQFVSLRLTHEGTIFRDEHGEPSVYATGHGDLPDALRASGLLDRFIQRGGKTVWIANLDNLGATVDPAILGFHLAHGGPLTVEVVNKVGSDKGGGPIRWNGRKIIAEEMRLPLGFDPAQMPVFSTNTFLVSAQALASLDLKWTYVEVDKTVGEAKAVQFERIVNEITTALDPQFLRVPRDGAASRFLPVKDVPELERRRPEIEAALRARGILA